MRNTKKRVFAIALAVCIFVLSIAGSSLAYFTDVKEYTNVFTAGNVKITLTEAVASKDDTTGNIVIADSNTRTEFNQNSVYNPLFPKQIIEKDPRITNTGSETAYVGAIISITNTVVNGHTGNIKNVLGDDKTAVDEFITGLPTTGATVTIVETTAGFDIYVVYTAGLAKNEYVDVFAGIEIPKTWNNTEMEAVNGLQIKVNAYATQTAGMGTDALAALKEAFDAFDSL